MPRIAVVGGGISGLAAAWRLRAELGPAVQILVLEKSGDIGGHLRVSDVAGVPVDEGAESLLARRPEAVELARSVGLDEAVVRPAPVGAGLWSRGRVVALPAGTVMGVPDDAAGERAGVMRVDSDVAIGRLVADRMGRDVVDRQVDPLLGGVYAGHADELSLDATVPALGAAVREHSSLSAAVAAVKAGAGAGAGGGATPGPVFAGIDGGVGRLPGAVAVASGAEVRTGVTVRELYRTVDGWRLIVGPVPAPEVIEADAVVVATPAAATARLLSEVAPAAATELAAIETASVAIVTLALPGSAFASAVPSSSGFLVPAVDGHLIKAVTWSSVKWPWLGARSGDRVIVRASVGRHREVADLQRDDDDLVTAVLGELGEAAGVSGRPLDARVTRWGGALPQYAVGHLDRVRRIRDAVGEQPGLAVCGAVYDGVGVPACVAAAGAAAVRVAAYLSERRARIEA